MMNRAPQGRGQPRLGATWYPGGQDDFYMPEVISPSPQRVMPEVPQTMQHNIAQLEHEARNPHRSQYGQVQYDRAQQHPQYPQQTSSAAAVVQSQSSGYDASAYEQSVVYDNMDQPNFSSFPVLRNPPPNVPPTDEQREASLETARMAVLSSNDPEMQLSWAQDTMAYVEVAMQNEARLALVQPPRPQTPPVEHQLKADAMNIVRFLADQFHPKADFMRGMWLEFGKFGFSVDKKEAFRAYSRAAEKGYARAEYRIGMQFESAGEPEKAIRHYRKGVALGDSASHYRLGMMMLLGQHGQPQDYQMGLEHIHLASESCDENAPQGAYVYGMLLARELTQVNVPEQFLPLDLNAARVNIEKAAYHGFAKAQVKIGSAYELCQLGCDFNPALSLHYNALAARQGEPEAEMAISKWFLCGHEGVFEKNDELAFKFAQRAAQSDFPTAEFALGYFYEVGIFVPVDIKEARSWYSKAASSGNKDATNRIDSISRSKTLSKKDHEKVAIARIKSRYGSHQRGNTLEPTPENIEMPDPSKMSLSDNNAPPAAPYPDRPSSRARPPYPNYAMPDPRPSSAFGVNPNLRANAPSYNRAASYGPGPMGYRHPSGAMTPSAAGPTSPPNMRSPSSTPKLDIGFSAPMESPGADPRRRPPRLDGVDRKPARTPMSPPSQGSVASPRPAVSSPSTASFSQPGQPSSKESAPSTPKPPPTSSSSTSASQKPVAGKGPKTFEEMGVPTVRKDNDCAADISMNLHNRVTKSGGIPCLDVYHACSGLTDDRSTAYAAKSLRELHQNKEIEGRTAGKQTVYHALQDSSDDASTEFIANLDQEIKQLQEQLTTLRANEKKARADLATLCSKPLLSELRQDIDRLEKEKESILGRLAKFHGNDSVQVSPAERAGIEREWKLWQKHASTRSRICRDMWKRCSEVVPEGMTREELWESLGLEGDCKW